MGILERRGTQREGDNENAGDLRRIYAREISQCHKPCPICVVPPPTLTCLILHHFLLLFALYLLVLLPSTDSISCWLYVERRICNIRNKGLRICPPNPETITAVNNLVNISTDFCEYQHKWLFLQYFFTNIISSYNVRNYFSYCNAKF